jgi:phospholipid/cholesterol/gamma-HCH transport system substrate-binding protein
MNATFTPPVRFSRLLLKVNAFLLIALLLAAAFIGLVAYKQGWFVQQTTIHFVTGNALGLNKGMPVKLHGFTVGSVSGMELAEGGVDVRLSIMSEYMPRIPRGSVAKHSREAGVVGAAVIDILPGKPGPALAQGERIDFEPSRSIAEYIDDIRRQAVPAFNELKQVLVNFKGSGEDIAVSLHALRAEMEVLPQTHRDLKKLLVSAEKAAADFNKQSNATLESIDRAVPELTTKLGSAIESIDGAAQQLRKTGEEAQGTIQRARPVLERGESVARDAGEVFNAAKRVWPLSDSFSDTVDHELPIDSFDARGKALKH